MFEPIRRRLGARFRSTETRAASNEEQERHGNSARPGVAVLFAHGLGGGHPERELEKIRESEQVLQSHDRHQ